MSTKVRVAAAALTLSAGGLGSIAVHEGTVNTVYKDVAGIATVCSGHTATVTLADLGKYYSPASCKYLLKKDTSSAEAAVKRLVKVPITQEQYDALVDFTFNVGSGNLASSTLLKKVNSNQCWAAVHEFYKWNRAGGKVQPGLVNRRADNARDYATGCD